MADSFFVSSSYLSTATVLYKRGGFTADEIDKLRKHTHDMSFDEIYSPGLFYDGSQTDRTLDGYVAQFFTAPVNGPPGSDKAVVGRPDRAADRPGRRSDRARRQRAARRQGRRRRAALDRDGPARLAHACQRRLGRDRRPLRVRHAQADQRRPLFRGLREDQGPAAGAVRSRSARAAAGRMGLPADLGDARHRLRHRRGAARHSAHLGLAIDLLEDAGQDAERHLFRLPRRRLHHGRGRPDRAFRDGARQSHGVGLDPDHRHAGVLRPRRAGLGAHPRRQARRHAGHLPR